MTKIERLAAGIRGGKTKRMHNWHIVGEYSVAEHTFNMLLIADMVCKPNLVPPILAQAILYHDLHEGVTGDIPWPTKREPEIHEGFKYLEERVNRQYDWHLKLPEDTTIILACIDMLEFIQFLLQQAKLGNTHINGDPWQNAVIAMQNMMTYLEEGNIKTNITLLYYHYVSEWRKLGNSLR